MREVRPERAGTGERIDKQGEPEMRIKVKAAQVTCTVGTDSGQCKTGKCISIGEDRVCTDCGKAGEVPINGKCVVSSDPSVTTTAGCAKSNGDLDDQSTTCGKCTKTGYFLHKGGCYAQATAPGSTICKAAGTAGLCEVCQAGYFKNRVKNIDATHQSCIACSETTAVDQYQGVANCAECTAPAASGSSGSSQKAKCTACADGYFVSSDGAACTQCQDTDNCAKCDAGADKCTKCKASGTKPYFKKNDGDDPTGTCVTREECKTTHFPKDISDSDKKCLPCGDATNGGIASC